MKNKNEKMVLIISLITAVLSAYSAICGFLDESLYGGIISTLLENPTLSFIAIHPTVSLRV
jgi:hypothetical protein